MWDGAAAVNIVATVYGLGYMAVLLLMQADAVVIMAMMTMNWNAICMHTGIV